MNKEQLIEFEERIAKRFLNKEIKAPIHLSKGNEDWLIQIFRQIKPTDWVFSTHRSHYHALLHGIPEDFIEKEIIEGRSIHIYNREHRFFSSAIVGGTCPIAMGVALAIKRKEDKSHVWCFIGDMAAETGLFHECSKYSARHKLPITWIIEDNRLSTDTPTQVVWGQAKNEEPSIIKYKYTRECNHVGCGKWVTF